MLVGGRVSVEDAYAYGKFARIALHTNDIDFRARPHSVEEADFLARHVVATGPDGGAVTYADLEDAKAVLLVGFEPEDESPIVFLRLRKGVRRNRTQVYAVAPFASRGLDKLAAGCCRPVPGSETAVLRDLGGSPRPVASALEALRRRRRRPRRGAAGHGARRPDRGRRARGERRRPAGVGPTAGR